MVSSSIVAIAGRIAGVRVFAKLGSSSVLCSKAYEEYDELLQELMTAVKRIYGEKNILKAMHLMTVEYVNPLTKVCINRALRDEHQKVWATITMVKSVGSCPVVFNLFDLSGEYM
ncbi:putative ribonuclease P/MRP protein subunit POP5 [Artemisia annua]|uniref:Putative ribonuclease P/MRP protein subunit POP5 n=1 Tax=Artemisia annua TaxID=35608 RepID=A0A2U1QDS8_ARTAN|nr:putative ribonuclease P/MRP protein subunit POP5 [Artemisia annua]